MSELVVRGRYGPTTGPAGVTAMPRGDVLLAEVMAFRGQEARIAQVLRSAYVLPLPDPRRRCGAGDFALSWAGPGRWLWEMDRGEERHLLELGRALEGAAAVVGQSDGRRLVRLGGPKVRDALAKGFTIDLHPAAFGVGDTALTVVAGMDVQISLIDDAPSFDIVVYRSVAKSFWHWLTVSAQEFGLDGRSGAGISGA